MASHRCNATCVQGWSPGRKAHCMVCGLNFTNVQSFDRHRKDGQCLFPEKVGLVLNDRGVWARPEERDYPPPTRAAATAD